MVEATGLEASPGQVGIPAQVSSSLLPEAGLAKEER
jgi:hypothetical protein